MRKFKFRLESVLKQREANERRLLREYAAARRALQVEEDELARRVHSREAAAARLREELTGRCRATELTALECFLECVAIDIRRQEARVEAAREIAEAKRLETIEAGKERKLVERLREKEWERYLAEYRRDEQKFLDEVGGSRFIAGRAVAEMGE